MFKSNVPILRDRTVWLPVVTFLVAGSVLVGLGWNAHTRFESHFTTLRERAANAAAGHLADQVNARLLAVEAHREAQEALGAPDTPEKAHDFRIRSEATQRQFEGFQAINWVAPDGTITIVAPLVPNRAALGRNLNDHPQAAPWFRSAVESRSRMVTGPIELWQGGLGFVVYSPVLRTGSSGPELIGVLNGVFRNETMVKQALDSRILGAYAVQVTDRESLVYESDDFAATGPTSTALLTVGGRPWRVTAQPTASLLAEQAEQQHTLPYLLAILLAALACLFLHRGLRTDQRRNEETERRRELEVQLQRTERMEALGRLAGGVAHDFNNIITAVRGNAELIGLKATDPKILRFSDQITKTCGRAGELTRQLSRLGTQFVDDVEIADIRAQLADLALLLERLLPSLVKLRVELPDSELWPIRTVAGDLSQVVINLAVNGADAMPNGGEVRVTVRNVAAGQRSAGAIADVDGVELAVEDGGVGMDAETIEHVFDPYFTTRRGDGGTGLGLSNVRASVDRTGGRIAVDSTVGKGTRFEVWFPSAASAPDAAPGSAR